MDPVNVKHIHPRPDDQGNPVIIHNPSRPTPLSAFDDPSQVAVVVPDGETPTALNGIEIALWTDAPTGTVEWLQVAGQTKLDEPPLRPTSGKRLSAGVVIVEPDRRFWAVAPTNAYGGYRVTFPKGTIDHGMTPQSMAIREAFEESGLQVEITGYIGDFERSTSRTRYYFARRTGGTPAAADWESQAVLLVPQAKLFTVLDHPNDQPLLRAMLAKLKA